MLLTYYMLIGGLINELFVRVLPLRAFAMAHAGHATTLTGNPVIGMTQAAAMMMFIVMILYFVIRTMLFRRTLVAPAPSAA